MINLFVFACGVLLGSFVGTFAVALVQNKHSRELETQHAQDKRQSYHEGYMDALREIEAADAVIASRLSPRPCPPESGGSAAVN